MRFGREVLPFSKQIEFPYLRSGFVLNNERSGKMVPIPLPVIRDKIYAPNRYLRGLVRYRAWGCRRVSSDFTQQDWVYVPSMRLTVSFHFFDVLANELDLWERFYAPPKPGMVVLDAGAGCGETAWVFLNVHKAKKVIALEPDPERFELLVRNARANGWGERLEAHNERFSPDHLRGVGFAKIDIEGGEWEYRGLAYPPTVMETHSQQIRRAFIRNGSGFRVVWDNRRGCSLIRNC